jgi:glutamate/aspartate transport system substrate-binding protein
VRRRSALLLASWLALAAGGALADDAPPARSEADSAERLENPPPVELTGTLAKARATGTVTIAYRDASIPFSYLTERGEPIGYSIELCRKLVDAMSAAVGRPLQIRWLPVTSDTRMEAITSGKADLECGSTTSNLERARTVAFSPTIFVSGTKLLVKRGSPIHSFRDLRGKTVVVTSGTTNEEAMRNIKKKFGVDFTIVTSRDHAESFAMVADGKADAFATDDVLLYGLIAKNDARGKYAVVGEFLSYDPYGIVFRKGDPQLARLVTDTFRDLADDGEVDRQYQRWFMKRLPTGTAINLPMSPQLETLVRAMAAKPD